MPLTPQEALKIPAAGGKARALAQLMDAGFTVPAWLVVPPDSEVPDSLAEMIVARVGPGPYAVRSSAIGEDGAAHSFAGQFSSFLNVPAAEVVTRIAAVRASAGNAHLASYLAASGAEHAVPAAIVQQMIEPRAAGVAFSADAVGGRRSVALVSAVPGLGEALVSGEANADTWEVDSVDAVRLGARGDAPVLCLGEDEVRAVAALARRCEIHFGRPQDIEWAIDGHGQLWLLQSRPITTLGQVPDPDDMLRVWDNSNIVESYGGVTTPLTFSFARKAYEHVYREFCRMLGVSAAGMARGEDVFPRMLGLIHGRVYYNLLSWYRVLALLPGFTLNRGFMEQMMGVKEPLPAELVDRVLRESSVSRWQDRIAVLRGMVGMVRQAIALPRMKRDFQHRLDDALRLERPLESMRAEDLVAHYRGLEAKLLSRWDAPLINDFFAMIAYGVLRSWCRTWAGDTSGTAQNSLLVDQGGIISAEPARAIIAMAARVSAADAVILGDPDQAGAHGRTLLANDPELHRAWVTYLEKFGDRCLEELKLESPTLRDDPAMLWAAIGAVAGMPARQAPARADAGAPRLSPVDTLAGNVHGPLRRILFRWLAGLAARRVKDRENLRFERTRLFGRVRAVMRELGKRLAADQRLVHGDEVFYLEVEEILGLFDATATTRDIAGLVAARSAEFAGYHAEAAPPDRLQTRGPIHRYRQFMSSPTAGPCEPSAASDARARTGTGASPGLVRGRVRVVRDPRDARMQAGEILVARQTDPGWVMLFPLASGLLVERGSLLSHSAIVSRELGLPCIVGLDGACAWLHDGDEVEMNGSTGYVTLITP